MWNLPTSGRSVTRPSTIADRRRKDRYLRRFATFVLVPAMLSAFALPAHATPRDTTIRTIRDTNGDNLLEYAPGEDYLVVGAPADCGAT